MEFKGLSGGGVSGRGVKWEAGLLGLGVEEGAHPPWTDGGEGSLK